MLVRLLANGKWPESTCFCVPVRKAFPRVWLAAGTQMSCESFFLCYSFLPGDLKLYREQQEPS